MFLAGEKVARVLALGIAVMGATIGAHTMTKAQVICVASIGGAAR
jgi:hypothetical protein